MTTYARIKQENGKTFLVDAEGNVLGQVVPLKGTEKMSAAFYKQTALMKHQTGYEEMLSAATVDVSEAIVEQRHVWIAQNKVSAAVFDSKELADKWAGQWGVGAGINVVQVDVFTDAMEKP